MSRLDTVSYSHGIATIAVSLAVSEIFSIKKWYDFEIRVWGRSRPLKMAPFNRPHFLAVISIAQSCTILELFSVEQYCDLEILLRGHSRSFSLVPFETLCTVYICLR